MSKRVRPLFLAGTASDVGKSVLAAGFCRIFKQDGYQPAPFKAQNMSLNSYATPDGFEIGRAQAVQAEACGLPCRTDMNPVLLKPTNERSSQLVLNGKPLGNQTALEYFTGKDQRFLFTEVTKAFDRLSNDFSPVVMEGAGSISELNLKERDIVNMRMAKYAKAAVYLIADIERGGVFASVYGTIALLTEQERALVKGIIINKFCGDIRLFQEGRQTIERLTGIPVVGIVPKFNHIYIEEEDSVALQSKSSQPQRGKVNVAVVRVKRISNFTDFNALERQPDIHLYYAKTKDDLEHADIVILPGSKNTVEDLLDLRSRGMDAAILSAYQRGKTVIGICGGYQMMGQRIADPYRVESDQETVDGLGLLPVYTVLTQHKTTEQRTFTFLLDHRTCQGYEIHMGVTHADAPSKLNTMEDGSSEGYFLNERCWGTYLHGILDNTAAIEHLLRQFLPKDEIHVFDYLSFKDSQYDLLADFMRTHIDMAAVYQQIKN